MSKPDLKGLMKLADYLHTVPNKEFDMGDWRFDSPCGTTACIAGHAAMLFPRRFQLTTTCGKHDEYKYYWFSHRASKLCGSSAFAEGFKISQGDAEQLTLYNVDSKATPKQAARAVRALVGRLEREMVKAGK